jgi:hypothetical protein
MSGTVLKGRKTECEEMAAEIHSILHKLLALRLKIDEDTPEMNRLDAAEENMTQLYRMIRKGGGAR